MAKNNKEITVVISSRKKGDEMQGYIEHVKETAGCPVKIIFVTNEGSMGLSELYGGMMANKNIDSEIMVFCHDDLAFLKSGWGAEVMRLFKDNKQYGIIGVAGSAQYGDLNTVGQGRWWNYPKKYGQVLHQSEGKSWLTCFSDLLDHDLEEVCVIDGLFMAVHRGRVTKNFDKDLNWFDMYDIDFSLANYIDGGCKVGVTTNIRIAHKSVGRPSEHYEPNLMQVLEKYKTYLPIDMPKSKDKRFKK